MTIVNRLRPKAITAPHHRGSITGTYTLRDAYGHTILVAFLSTGIIDTHFHVHWRLNLGTHACVTSTHLLLNHLSSTPPPRPLPNILAALKLEFISIQQHLLIVTGTAFSLSGP